MYYRWLNGTCKGQVVDTFTTAMTDREISVSVTYVYWNKAKQMHNYCNVQTTIIHICHTWGEYTGQLKPTNK